MVVYHSTTVYLSLINKDFAALIPPQNSYYETVGTVNNVSRIFCLVSSEI